MASFRQVHVSLGTMRRRGTNEPIARILDTNAMFCLKDYDDQLSNQSKKLGVNTFVN